MGALHRVRSFRNTAPIWVHGPQFLPENLLHVDSSAWTTSLTKNLFIHGLSISCNFLQGTHICVGSFMGFKGTTVVSPQAASGAWRPSLLLLHWLYCLQDCSSHVFLTFLSHICCAAFFMLSQIHIARGATTVGDELILGQQQVCFGANWNWLCLTRGLFLASSYRGHTQGRLCSQCAQ